MQHKTNEIKKKLSVQIGIVCSTFNPVLSEGLVGSCQRELINFGISKNQIFLSKVPGSLEISLVLLKLLSSKKFDVLIAFGSIIRGETSHYETVAHESASSITQLTIMYGIPIINGILTVENMKQAKERVNKKGKSCALSALNMVEEMRRINNIFSEKN
jgi:6,7-dimethyl-8-ribityllumazine synthase